MDNLNDLFERRHHSSRPWYRRGSVIVSIGLHTSIVAAALFAPTLLTSDEPPPEFVSIQIVPAAALGQTTPPPPRAETVRAEAPPSVRSTGVSSTSRSSRRKRAEPAKVVERRTTTQPRAESPAPVVSSVQNDQPVRRRGSPRGNPLASGAGASVSSFDDPNFTYGYYADLLLARIRERWERPPLGGEVEMIIHFRVFADGHVEDARILRSSGYNSFDRAGLLAVQRADMPPLPQSYRSPSLGIRLVIR